MSVSKPSGWPVGWISPYLILFCMMGDERDVSEDDEEDEAEE